MAYRLVRWLARRLLHLFYRRVGAIDLDKVPAEGPLVVAANHHGSLIDPMALIATLPRRLRPLAKAPLFAQPLVRPFLDAVGALPVYRPQDRHLVEGSNQGLLVACGDALARGECILIFPEGLSKPEPTLSGLKPGAARMALEAEAASGFRLGTRILPVAIHLDGGARFRRGKILVQVGDPLAVADLKELHAGDPDRAVRELTLRLERALRERIVEVESTETLRLLRLAARAWARERGERLDDAAETRLLRDFAKGYRVALREHPKEAVKLRAAIDAYARTLEHFHLGGDEIDFRYTGPRVAAFVLKDLTLLLLGAPLGLVGAALNYLPYRMTWFVAGRLSEGEDVWASLKICSAIALFPLCWLVTALGAGFSLGAGWGLFAFALGPLLGPWAVRFRDRQAYVHAQVRAFLLLAGGGGLRRHLQESRKELYHEVERVRALFAAPRGPARAANDTAGPPSPHTG